MKVFRDTNIVLEYLLKRQEAKSVKAIFLYLKRKGIEKVLSSDSFYTLTYLIENHLKKTVWKKTHAYWN